MTQERGGLLALFFARRRGNDLFGRLCWLFGPDAMHLRKGMDSKLPGSSFLWELHPTDFFPVVWWDLVWTNFVCFCWFSASMLDQTKRPSHTVSLCAAAWTDR